MKIEKKYINETLNIKSSGKKTFSHKKQNLIITEKQLDFIMKNLLKEQGLGDYIQGLTKSPNQGDTVYGQTKSVRDIEKQQAAIITKQLETDPNKRLINFAEDIAANIYSTVTKYSEFGSTILPGTPSHEGYCNKVLTQLKKIEEAPGAQFYDDKKVFFASLWQIVLEWIKNKPKVETKTQSGASSWIYETLEIMGEERNWNSGRMSYTDKALCPDLEKYWRKNVSSWKSQIGNWNFRNVIKPELKKS